MCKKERREGGGEVYASQVGRVGVLGEPRLENILPKFFSGKTNYNFFFFFDGKYLTSFRLLKNKYIMCTHMCHLTGIVLQPNNHVLNILGMLS